MAIEQMSTYDEYCEKIEEPQERPRDTTVVARPKPMSFKEFYEKAVELAGDDYVTARVTASSSIYAGRREPRVVYQVWIAKYARWFEGDRPEIALAEAADHREAVTPSEVDVGF